MEQDIVRASVERSWNDEVLPSLAGLVEIPALSPAFDAHWPGQWPAAGGGGPRAGLDRRPRAARGAPARSSSWRGGPRCFSWTCPPPPGAGTAAPCCCTGTWTSSRRSAAGPTGSARGRPCCATAGCTAAARSTTATRATRRPPRWRRCRRPAASTPGPSLLLETGEESGSPDLPAYMEHLAGRLGDVTFVVCLDGGGGDYERHVADRAACAAWCRPPSPCGSWRPRSTPGWPAASCRARSGSCGSCWTGWRTPRPGRSSCPR